MAAVSPDPHRRLAQRLESGERRLRALERGGRTTYVVEGPRSDDPHGDGTNWGPRVVVGLLSDDSYGVERWLEDGTRETPTWS